jgi:hypothetical protein
MKLSSISKQALVEEALSLLNKSLQQMTHHANKTAAGATHAESRPENNKDTRGLETSYLARGQATRAMEIETEIQQLRRLPLTAFGYQRPIAASALVRLTSPEQPDLVLFLTPGGGGISLPRPPLTVRLVTPRSPLGAAVLGKQRDDIIGMVKSGEQVEYEITEVA